MLGLPSRSIMQIINPDDDCFPRFSLQRHRSSCASFSNLLLSNGFARKSFSYSKLAQEPLKLKVLKLDGSSFEVEVAKTATVAELKQAVEAVFSHLPKEGPGKISWSHVWRHFCLCYLSFMLIADNEYIGNYGIKDGDQLRFIQNKCNQIKMQPIYQEADVEQPLISYYHEEREVNGEKCDGCDDEESLLPRQNNDGNIVRHGERSCSYLFRGWFSCHGPTGSKRYEGCCLPSRLADSFMGSFRSITKLYGNRYDSPREAWKEV